MMTFKLRQSDINALRASLNTASKNIERDIAIVINKTAKDVRRDMRNRAKGKIAASPAKIITRTMNVTRKARKGSLHGRVTLDGTSRRGARISLKYFRARQAKKGTTFRIDKTGGRGLAPKGFMGPRPGAITLKLHGHVFKRKGKKRLPITKLHGPSVYAVFKKHGLKRLSVAEGNKILHKRMRERIRFHTLKNAGLI